ncbi:hypothetical protein [Occallatibacter riparius]|uniref:Uncharacterized protein n=1 Tax=Occallatibacter riparius TaxID=1002689 RepID=A0A9J7BPU4_9BACT|nr:hypothetical protein [Occallatibacter riparius]UWZ84553.1 hypothetical protein MOP44_01140 [Occallatibacter riparius]
MTTTTTGVASHTTVLNSIVKLCNAAYEDTLAAEKARGLEIWKARDKAKEAFMRALPNLTARTSVCAYIACIGRAMALEIVTKPEGAKLLYAAQIAMNALPKPAPEAGGAGPGGNLDERGY